MRQEQKKFIFTSVIYGITGSFASIINLLIIPVIEGKDRLSALDFSQIAIVESITVLIYLVSYFSGGSAISRFFWEHRNSSLKGSQLINSVICFILFRGLILLGIILVLSKIPFNVFSQPELKDFGVYAIPALIIGISRAITNSVSTLLRNQKRIFIFSGFNIVTTIIRGLFQLAGVFFIEMSFMGYVYGSLIGSTLVLIMSLSYIWLKFGFHFNYSIIREIRVFVFPLFIFEIMLWVMTYADRFFLERFPVEMGIYDIAMRFALGIRLIIQGFQGASQPEVFDLLSRQKNSDTNQNLRTIANMQMAQTQFIIMISILPAIYYILHFCDSNIREASKYIPLVFTLSIVKSQYLIFSLPILFEKKTRLMLAANSVGILVSLSINFFLIPLFGIYAAIFASLLSDISMFTIIYLKGRFLKEIQWNVKKTIFVPLLVVLFTVIIEIISNEVHLNPYIQGSIVTLGIMLALALLYLKDVYCYYIRYFRT